MNYTPPKCYNCLVPALYRPKSAGGYLCELCAQTLGFHEEWIAARIADPWDGSPDSTQYDRREVARRRGAIVDGRCKIGDNTEIWANAALMGDARVGTNCVIGQGAYIGPLVAIGNGCKIQNGAQLFEGVALQDDVFIGPHVVFTNVLTPRAFIDRKREFKLTLVKRGASIGANATIICGVTIGKYAMVGAGSVVTRNVEPHALVVGNPAKHTNWVCRCGVQIISDRRNNPAMTEGANGVVTCHACGTKLKLRFSPLYPYQIDVVGIIDAEVP